MSRSRTRRYLLAGVISSLAVGCGVAPAERTVVAGRAPAADDPDAVAAAPADTIAGDTLPVDTVPVDTTPVDTVPVDTVPVDTVPVDDGSGSFEFSVPSVCAPPAARVDMVLLNTTRAPQHFHWMNLLRQAGQPAFQIVLQPAHPQLIAVDGNEPLIWPPVGPETLPPGESVELTLLTPATEGEFVLEMVHIAHPFTLTVSVATQCVDSWVLPSSA